MTKAFVVAACGVIDDGLIRTLQLDAAEARALREPGRCGGSVIVAPNSRIIAGPLGSEEGILYADCDVEIGVQMKLRHDFAGHYNRPDIFQPEVNRAAPAIYTVHGMEKRTALPPGPRPPATPAHAPRAPARRARKTKRR